MEKQSFTISNLIFLVKIILIAFAINFVFIIFFASTCLAQTRSNDCPPCDNFYGSISKEYGDPCHIIGNFNDFLFTILGIRSRDPNSIVSPIGYGAERFVARKDYDGYIINFENDEGTATAPAKVVRITYPLNSNQDKATFRLGDFGFNNIIFHVPPNSNIYNTRLDLIDSLNLLVDVTAGINVLTNEAFWIFESIDPRTGLPPTDPMKGFLLIRDSLASDSNQVGRGFVNFSLKPKANSHTGDTILAQGSIVFDSNDPVLTNIEKNTIDAQPPVSTLSATNVQNDSIELHFSAHDDNGGSGVAKYDLYMAQDSSNYTLFQSELTDTIIKFHGVAGSTFHFFTLATDNVGNREQIKILPDVTVDFTRSVTVIVKAFIQGYYLGNGTLRAVINPSLNPSLSDTLVLQLANSISPYNIISSDTSVLQTNGLVRFHFDSTLTNNCYLILRHRNTLESWSATPLPLIVGNNLYDFTVSDSRVYGNNATALGDGYYGLFSGDIVQDGIIESTDYSVVENAVGAILNGYHVEDLNGDGVVTLEDERILDANLRLLIRALKP